MDKGSIFFNTDAFTCLHNVTVIVKAAIAKEYVLLVSLVFVSIYSIIGIANFVLYVAVACK